MANVNPTGVTSTNLRLAIAVVLLWMTGLPSLSVIWVLPLGAGNYGRTDGLLAAALLQALLGSSVYLVKIMFGGKKPMISTLEASVLGTIIALPTVIYGTIESSKSIIVFSVTSTIILILWSRRLINGYAGDGRVARA